jgi:hypothetical protein
LVFPSNPLVALWSATVVSAVLGVFFVLYALIALRAIDQVPVWIAFLSFGLANLLASALLFNRSEWGRRLAMVLTGLWFFAGGTVLALGVPASLFWSHTVSVRPLILIGVPMLAYAWTFFTLLRTDVGCVLS